MDKTLRLITLIFIVILSLGFTGYRATELEEDSKILYVGGSGLNNYDIL